MNENSLQELQDVLPALPTVLARRRTKQYAAAVLSLAATVAGAFLVGWKMLLLLFIPAYFAWLGFSLEHNYRSGRIRELALICTSAKASRIKDLTYVTFKTSDDVPAYCKFSIPGRNHAERFIVNAAYAVYYDTQCPDSVMEYVQL